MPSLDERFPRSSGVAESSERVKEFEGAVD
jgi:hypothetical protein